MAHFWLSNGNFFHFQNFARKDPMNKKSIRITRRHRRGSISFNPDRQFISNAVDEFLKQGGKIEQLKPDERSFKETMARHEGSLDADEFLMEG